MILSPSLLSADFYNIEAQLTTLYQMGVRDLHLDVMDGNYVPNISFGPPVIRAIKKGCEKSGISFHFDVHLMVDEPARFVEDYVKAGADGITIHVESCKHLDRCINQIRSLGLKVGVSLNPATPLGMIEEVLPMLDMVLLMSVNPGFGGQKYISYISDKIRRLDQIRRERDLTFSIQVDGGVNRLTLDEVMQTGVDNIVAGSAIFDGDMQGNVEYFLEKMRSAREKTCDANDRIEI